jgi:hypothetical protein
VLGGAQCLHDDLRDYAGPIDGVVAANAAMTETEQLDAAVSLHPQYWIKKGWLAAREAKGYAPAPLYTHDMRRAPYGAIHTGYAFPGQEHSGSSGMFAAKVALIDLGFDIAVLCGIPMSPMPHFTGETHWDGASHVPNRYLKRWRDVPEEYTGRIRSMSGATRDLFGAP